MAGEVGRKGRPFFALGYAIIGRIGQPVIGKHRRRLLAHASGQVVEIGAGTGLNFRYYPSSVARVLASEPDPYMLKRLRNASRRAAVLIGVVDATAESLPLDDASADTVVATLMLCSVEDPVASLGEAWRVLKPHGRLLFFEHVRSVDPKLAANQDRRAKSWGRLAGGCRPNRDTEASIRMAGFEVEEIDHFDVKGSKTTRPHILGVARKPAEQAVLASDP